MDTLNSSIDILNYAIAREIQAQKAYLYLADQMKNPAMRKIFEIMAEEEQEHCEKMELEIIKLGHVLPESPPVFEDSPEDFGQKFNMELGLNYSDALKFAIAKEKASFKLYVELAGKIQEHEMHEMLLELAEEELRHKMRFEAEYNQITPHKT